VHVDRLAHLFSPSPLDTLETNSKKKKNHVRIQRKLTAFYKEIPKIKNPLCVFCNQITCYPVLDETIIKYDEKWRWFYCSVVKQNRSRNSKNRGFCEVGNPR
jgi:hypothetical protein